MKLALWWLALGAFPLHGQVAAVALYTEFKHPASASVVASLEQEAASIMAPLGLDLEWKSLAGFRAGESARRLVVTTFRGTCDTRGLMPAPVESSGLGWTYMTDGELQSFIAVDCDRIRAFVRGPLYRTDPRDRDRILGRAIGRVIAHELYHALGRTTHHGSGRVGHAAYTVRELIDDDTPIDQDECRILRFESEPPAPGSATPASTRNRFFDRGCAVCHGAKAEGTRRGPALRGAGRPGDSLELATRLGINAHAMCRGADQLKMPPPAVTKEDLDRLVEFLNGL